MKLHTTILALLLFGASCGHAADVKISALPDGSTIQATDQIPINRGGTTNRVVVGPLAVLASGTSGGIPYFSGVSTVASSAALTASQILLGGGAGAAPTALGSLGTTTTLLHGNAAGPPSFAAIAAADVNALVPTWTGIHTFALAEPRIIYNETDQGTDLKIYDIDQQGGKWCIRTRTDADGAGVNGLCFTRGTTTNISIVDIGNATSNPAYNFLGSGTVTLTGGISGSSGGTWTAGRVVVNSATIATNGLYLPAANTVGLSANSTQVFTGTTTQFTVAAGLQSGGTKFTASGCTNSATVGGAVAGEFASGTTGACTVTLTLPTATNKWHCSASDRNNPANLISESAATTTSSTITGTTVTGDVIAFSCMAY